MYLHVLNGDATRIILEQTEIPGEMLVWADVLHDGPVPADASGDRLRELRARHLAQGNDDLDEVGEQLRRADERLDRYADYDEVVFWFEHDLFDQLLLIRHLRWLSTLRDRSRFRLICIDRFPGHPDFAGLGELNPAELASLFPRRQPLTEAQIALGSRLWLAFGASDPRLFSDLVMNGDTSALPFAAGALRRQLEDFPSLEDGLARTERQILTAIRDGEHSAMGVFKFAAHLEERVFMGDLTAWGWMERMTQGHAPLIALDGEFHPGRAPSGTFTMTDAGRAVLDGRADYIELNGIDRWMGGVHLTDGRYRWTGEGVR
jgi:hypothetical protein